MAPDAVTHLRLDVRADRVTELDVELAQRISAVAAELRLHTTIGVGQDDRSVQVLEIGSDTLDAAAIRPF